MLKSSLSRQGILPISEKYDSSFSLVGHGFAYLDCGETRFRGCLNVDKHHASLEDSSREGKVFVEVYYRSCNRRECPKCFEKWVSLESLRASYRLLGFCRGERLAKKVFSIPDKKKRVQRIERAFRGARYKPIHVIFSVPVELYGLSYVKLRSKMYKIAKKSGVFGGCVVFHHLREDEFTKKWSFSPHFHVVGFGWVRNVFYLYKKSGWIIKNMGTRKTVLGTLNYELSHASIHEKRHVVTWFGKLAYNKLKIDPMPEVSPVCPLCHCELRELLFIGGLDRPPPDVEGEYYLPVGDWILKPQSYL